MNNGKQKAFIGNYLNVNEVEKRIMLARIFDNPNADYMPKKNYIAEQ